MNKDTLLYISMLFLVIGFLEIILTKKNKYLIEGSIISLIGIGIFIFLGICCDKYNSINYKYKNDITKEINKIIETNYNDNQYIEYDIKKYLNDYANDNNITFNKINTSCTDSEDMKYKQIEVTSNYKYFIFEKPLSTIKTKIYLNKKK